MAQFMRQHTKSAKLTAALVGAMRERYAQGGITQGALAREYNVSVVQVGRILRGESWQQLPTVIGLSEMEASMQRLLLVQKEVDEKKKPSALEKMQGELQNRNADTMLEEIKGEKK